MQGLDTGFDVAIKNDSFSEQKHEMQDITTCHHDTEALVISELPDIYTHSSPQQRASTDPMEKLADREGTAEVEAMQS
jgi:hypothetical protein